jgi:integrase
MNRKPNRNAQGAGSIRQRKDGTWEARFTLGRDPGSGKQKQKSIYAATQKDVLQKLQQIQNDLNTGTYIEPDKLTVSAWLDTWTAEYLGGDKESTQASYKGHVKNHIKPALGAVLLQKLQPPAVLKFYNDLGKAGKTGKTVRNIHGVLHAALDQAVKLGYIRVNPTTACPLPRKVKPDIKVMNDAVVAAFLKAIEGHHFEAIYFVDLFSGLRQAEILGLSWDNVNLAAGTIFIDRQLVKSKIDGRYFIDTAKHDKARTVKLAPVVIKKFRERKSRQAADQLRAGAAWRNEWNLVFTDELGKHLVHHTVRKNYKRIVADIGAPDMTFHGMRHSYAVISLMSGDDVKTVQENLGHHTAAFTLDTYAHATDMMKEASANRMEEYIKGISKA